MSMNRFLTFQQLLEECTIGTYGHVQKQRTNSCFSSCQKNVLLGPDRTNRQSNFETHVSVVVRRMYYWDILIGIWRPRVVSVVVRRMYYWDRFFMADCKGVLKVSVVVRRMYYWDANSVLVLHWCSSQFQQLLEECTIGTVVRRSTAYRVMRFSSCQKNVLLGHDMGLVVEVTLPRFQQLLEECTIGTYLPHTISGPLKFQQLLEECTIGT